MNAYQAPLTARFVALVFAVAATVALFSAVIALAMQPQTDGSTRLAHAAVSAPHTTQQTLVAQADSPLGR